MCVCVRGGRKIVVVIVVVIRVIVVISAQELPCAGELAFCSLIVPPNSTYYQVNGSRRKTTYHSRG